MVGIRLKLFVSVFVSTFFIGVPAHAERIYAELDAMRTTIEAEGAKFKPYNVKGKLGYIVMQQVAVELQYAALGDDEDSGSKLELDQIYGAYLRLESLPRNRVKFYVLAGYAASEFAITGKQDFTDEFDGFSWGIGAEDQIVSLGKTFFIFEYMQYYKNDGVDISGISLGLRHLF
jgi:hypothetical protein